MTGLLDGGYIAVNEVDQNTAQSSSEQSRVEAERAKLVDAQLSVDDCVLRAPFDGDVAERWVDPGAFVRPGEPVVSVVDRNVIRLVVDVPEGDFSAVAPDREVQIHLLALDQDLAARISRRSPSADPSTRTIHTEIDLTDPDHHIPVNTTAEVVVAVGQAVPATAIPIIAADLSQDKAKLFTVADSVAHVQTSPVLGEAGGQLYFQPTLLSAGTAVVLEGRAALNDKDRVNAQGDSRQLSCDRSRLGRRRARPRSRSDGGTTMTRLALRNPIAILMICVALVVFAFVLTPRMAVDTFPALTPPVLIVGTQVPGLGPREVEKDPEPGGSRNTSAPLPEWTTSKVSLEWA